MGKYVHLDYLEPPGVTLGPLPQTGFGHRPKIIITFWGGRGDAVNAAGIADIRRGFGALTDTLAFVLGYNIIVNGAAASNNGGSITPSIDPESFEAGLILPYSIDADGVTWNYILPTSFPEPIRFGELSLSDELVERVGFALPVEPLAPGDVDATLGFQPDAVIVVSAQRLPDNSDPSKSALSVGLAAGPQGSVTQGHVNFFSRGTGASSDTRTFCQSGSVYSSMDDNSNVNSITDRASVDWLPTGCRLSFDVAAGDQRQILVIGLKMAAGARAVVELGPVGRNPLPVSSAGSYPLGGMFVGAGIPESVGVAATAGDAGTWGAFEVGDDGAISQVAHAWFNQDGKSPQVCGASIDYDATVSHMQDATTQDGKVGVLAARPGEIEVGYVGQPHLTRDFFATLMFALDSPTPQTERVAAAAATDLSAPIASFVVDPGERLDLWIDWSAALVEEDLSVDAIESSEWVAESAGPVIHSHTLMGQRTHVEVSMAQLGTGVRLQNTVKTAAGRTRVRRVILRGRNL